MNLLLFDACELGPDGAVVVQGRRARHVAAVLRARRGQRVRVGMVRGRRGYAVVDEVEPTRCRLTVDLEEAEPVRPALSLVLAVPRPKVVSRALQIAASFGVARIDLVNAWKVDKSYLGSRRLDPAALGDDCWLGCEQGATTWTPEIAVWPRFVPFVERALAPRVSAGGVVGLVCDVDGADGVEATGAATASEVVVAIGPEGGWIDKELASLRALGFRSVGLTRGILRTEAAVAAALAQVELVRRGAL